MAELTLFSFIVNNFQTTSIRSAVVFHCWQPQDAKLLAEKVSLSAAYAQFADLTTINENLVSNNMAHSYLKRKRPIIGVFIDINCPKAEFVLNGASLYRLFNGHYHWLIYDRYGNLTNFQLLFDRANVTVDSDVTFAVSTLPAPESNSSTKYFLQYDVYNNGPHIGGKLNMTQDRSIGCTISECFIERYLSDLHKRYKYGNRNRQSDISMRIATVTTGISLSRPEEEKIAFLLARDQPSIDSISRFGFSQVWLVKDMLQCRFQYRWHNEWTTNDSYGGILGDLIDESTDLISSNLIISPSRFPFVIPTVECSTFHSICLFRTPRKTGLRRTGEVYLDPFSRTVWLMFGAVIVIGAIQLWGIFFVERYGLSSSAKDEPSFPTSLLISFGTVCAQGSSILPITMSGRMAYTALDIASFIMFNYYTSIIVSTLLGAPLKSDITTIAQLADSPLELGVEPIQHNFAYLNTSIVPAVRQLVKQKIYSKKNPASVFMSTDEGIKRVRDEPGKFAYVFEASAGFGIVEKYYEPDEICDLNEILLRPQQNLNFFLHKNSSYIELIRLRLVRLLETGVNRRNVRYFLRNRLYCFPSNKIVTVGIENTAALFFVLIISFILASLVMVLEMIVHKSQSMQLEGFERFRKKP